MSCHSLCGLSLYVHGKKSGDKQWHVILIQVLTFLPKITSPNPGPWKWNGTPVPAPVEQKER